MYYLSRVAIDGQNRQKIRDLSHLGAYHNWVESSFPEEMKSGIRSRKLWRIDRLRGVQYLIVSSDKKPDLERLERYGIPGSAQTKCYDQFLHSIEEQQIYRFRVTLNPVKSLSQGAEKRGRVVPAITAEQQLNYLESRANGLGFALISGCYQIVDRSWKPYRKTGQRMINLLQVTYEGMLRVTNKESFLTTITGGIGKKKAYGFGMMTVMKV